MYIQKDITKGYNEYSNLEKNDAGTCMDVGLLILEEGETYIRVETEKEAAYLLLEGSVFFEYGDKKCTGNRPDTFHYDPWCLHVSKDTAVTIRANKHSEIYVQKTWNEKAFKPVLYGPKDTQIQHAGAAER